jgi:ribonuclease P protein component
VDRNLLKRRIREAYRMNKHSLYKKLGKKHIQMVIQYRHKEILGYREIEEALLDGWKTLFGEAESGN